MPNLNAAHERQHHTLETIKLLFRGLIPFVILTSGIILLALRLPGWSIILGLPMVILGVVFLIYTYDEIVSKSLSYDSEEMVSCRVCGKPTPRLLNVDIKHTVCFSCQEKGC